LEKPEASSGEKKIAHGGHLVLRGIASSGGNAPPSQGYRVTGCQGQRSLYQFSVVSGSGSKGKQGDGLFASLLSFQPELFWAIFLDLYCLMELALTAVETGLVIMAEIVKPKGYLLFQKVVLNHYHNQ
jgi:hypothetical protein